MVSQGRIGRIAWLNQDDGAAAPVAVTPQSKETEQQMEEKRKAELEALDAELLHEKHHPGNVAARSGHVLDDALADWIGHLRKYNRNGV